MSAAVERVHTGLGLRLLYPLGGKVPLLRALPPSLSQPVRRLSQPVRRRLTAFAVREWLRHCPETRIVAVTGSMGKTTTKDLLGAMLASAGPTMITRGNDNGVHGVPATLLSIRPRDRFAVVEAGILDRGDMAWMASMFRPELAILTGIGEDHSESLGTIEAVIREKQALLDRLGSSGTAVVNADDERALAIASRLPGPVITAGRSAEADVRVRRTRLDWPRGLEVTLSVNEERHVVPTLLLGEHRAPQLALALAAALSLGVPSESALEAAASVPSRPGRLQPVAGPVGSLLLLDDHKARPATISAALATLARIPAQRRIAVLGELQDVAQDPETYAAVARSASEASDLVLAVGGSGPALRPGLRGRTEMLAAKRPSEAAALLLPRLRKGDAVLICAGTRQHALRIALRLSGHAVGCDVARCVLHWRCTDCPHLPTGPPARVIESA